MTKPRLTIAMIVFILLIVTCTGAIFFQTAGTVSLDDDRFAPGFSLKDESGKKYFAPVKGKNNLLIFFSNSCPSCNKDKKEWPRAMKIFKDNKINIFGISENNTHTFFPVLLDKQRTIFKLYSVMLIPTYVLVDKKGLIVKRGMLGEVTRLIKAVR